MLFIDASAYLSLLIPSDSNHKKAKKLARQFSSERYVTSQAVLGEVITVGSQRFDKKLTIEFIEAIQNSPTLIILEEQKFVNEGWEIFKKAASKNISWVDCFSQAIINHHAIKKVFTFDEDFSKLAKIK